jgi:DNA segregation ATPase FtsK/SpoIIIE-like protein
LHLRRRQAQRSTATTRPAALQLASASPWTSPSRPHTPVVETVTQVAPSCPQWAGQIFIQQAGRRTFLLHVTSDDTVASLKARLKWPDSRLIKSPLELWDDTRSLGSYGVRKEDTLLLCGRLCGGGVCMGKPTVVAPGENIAPQDAAPAPHAPAAPTAPEEVAAPAALYQAERPARKKAEEEAQREEERRRVAAEAEAQKKAEEERKKTEAERRAAKAAREKAEEEAQREEERKRVAAEAEAQKKAEEEREKTEEERRAAKAARKKAEEEALREEERKRVAAGAEAPAARARKACVPSVVATANEVAQRHAKICMDVSGLIRKGKFGGIDLFDSMLEEQVGYMDATALRGMYAEHCMGAASLAPFSPPNNPSLICTPEREFWYVVGKDGIDIAKWEVKSGARPAKYDGCMVEGRNDTPLSELLEADEAKRAKLRDTELIALRLYSGKKSFSGRRYGCPVVSILLHLPYSSRYRD